MGLFANFATACASAFFKGDRPVWGPSLTATRHLQTLPQRVTPLVAQGTPHSGTREQQLPMVVDLDRHTIVARQNTAPCSRPAVKLRAWPEHDGHPANTSHRVRMVISGRMADVCAELERLVALENRVKAPALH